MIEIAALEGVDRATFDREVAPRQQPVVLRGLLADWPAVRAARQSDAAICALLESLDSGAETDALMVPPRHRGRIFYADDWNGFNYLRNRITLSQVIEQVQRYAHFAEPPAVAVQSAPASRCTPAFAAAHAMPLLDAGVEPRLWFGNAIRTPAHFDESSNVACVVAGSRRFTLFPPEQIANLYVGPIGNAPTGTPVSFCDPDEPDFERHPRFAAALEHARRATLGPGDALYIPPLWWHHVRSLARVNLLVNYWWSAGGPAPSALDALLYALHALGAMPPVQRAAWRAFYEHWVFGADETTAAHIPPAMRGVHGEWTPELVAQVRRLLRQRLAED